MSFHRSLPVYAYAYDPDQVLRGERRALVERVRPGAVVLDVGCWSGFTGRHLHATRAATVDGIEPDAAMARRAAASYRAVRVGSAEEHVESLEISQYDAVLALDVLEHMVDPWSFLRALRPSVRPSGRLMVSVPNAAHWWVRKELMLGRFAYQRCGILDRTHLRFFTADTAGEMLETSGWSVTWRGVSLDQPPLVRVPARHLHRLRRWPGLFAAQCLFEARPA